MAAATAVMAGVPATLQAQNWLPTVATTGNYAWENDANWSAAHPNGATLTANVTSDIFNDTNVAGTEILTITVPPTMITLGTLNIGDSGTSPDSNFRVGLSGAGTLIFDNGANDAVINAGKDLVGGDINNDDIIGANVQLNSTLVLNVPNVTGDHL